jgi:hypothetical protein
MKMKMKMTKIAMLAVATSLVAGAAFAGQPRSSTWDKVKPITCENPNFEFKITYDYLDYGNGNNNKVVITKGISNVLGGRPIVNWTGVNPQGYDLVTGLTASPGSFVVDIVNGNDTRIYDDTRFYTRCTIPQLN